MCQTDSSTPEPFYVKYTYLFYQLHQNPIDGSCFHIDIYNQNSAILPYSTLSLFLNLKFQMNKRKTSTYILNNDSNLSFSIFSPLENKKLK